MLGSETLPGPPTKEALRELADLAGVPRGRRAFYYEEVCRAVTVACERELLANGLRKKQGEALHRSAVAMQDALDSLNDDEVQFISGVLNGKAAFAFDLFSNRGIDGLRQTTYQLTLLYSLLTGKPDPRYPHLAPLPRKRGKSPGGRRPGSIKRSIFQDFVFELWLSTKTAGGKLSFERYPARGSVTTALKKLTEYLPGDFVPKALPAPTLQKLRIMCSEAIAAVDQLESALKKTER